MISTAPLVIEAIRQAVGGLSVGRHLYLFGEVDSTNAALVRLARDGAVEGTAVLAEAQRAGRGRLGREWFSPPGVNLYVSVLFRPGFAVREALRFSFIASLALADAVRQLALEPSIKWPNDVLVQGKKVAGTLVECPMRGDEIECLVLGVGVNVNVDHTALRAGLGREAAGATSLAAALGYEVDRNTLAASYLTHLDRWAERYRTAGPAAVVEAWQQRDILTGRRVEVRRGEGFLVGRALGVDPEGRLVVEDALGRRHTVLTEEIRMLD